MGEMVKFQANGREADGYLATPAAGRGPAVVVIQEWWGLVPQIKGVADRFSATIRALRGVDEKAFHLDDVRRRVRRARRRVRRRTVAPGHEWAEGRRCRSRVRAPRV